MPANWSIKFSPIALKLFKKFVPPRDKNWVKNEIKKILSKNPDKIDGGIKKLESTRPPFEMDDVWQLTIEKYRIIYELD